MSRDLMQIIVFTGLMTVATAFIFYLEYKRYRKMGSTARKTYWLNTGIGVILLILILAMMESSNLIIKYVAAGLILLIGIFYAVFFAANHIRGTFGDKMGYDERESKLHLISILIAWYAESIILVALYIYLHFIGTAAYYSKNALYSVLNVIIGAGIISLFLSFFILRRLK